jgi:hypothetical protein
VLTEGEAHPVVNTATPHRTTGEPALIDDVIYPGVCVDGRANPACPAGPEIVTFEAKETVEIRLALGGERDWDFDWTTFHVPSTQDAVELCKGDGWSDLGFRNLGQCIRWANTGKDSRD